MSDRPRAEAVPHGDATRRVLEKLRKASPEELLRTFVRSGIVTPDGALTPEFGGPPAAERQSARAPEG